MLTVKERREGRGKNNVTLDNERDRISSVETQQSIYFRSDWIDYVCLSTEEDEGVNCVKLVLNKFHSRPGKVTNLRKIRNKIRKDID